MSNSVDNSGPTAREALNTLEGTVNEALERLALMTARAEAAESKSAELGELMHRITDNPAAAGDVLTRLKSLEEENADLRKRLESGRAGVERLLAKVRFLENQR